MTEQTPNFKSGYVAIVGEPNVGKSTLMNALLDQKISIVTRKPQTTRQRVLGILSRRDAQIIFLDTPGLLKPKYLLHEKMVRSAQSALEDADVIVLLTEVANKCELSPTVREQVVAKHRNKPLLLVMNKVDTVYKPNLLPLIDGFIKQQSFREVIPISALKRQNLDDFLATVLQYLPVHEPYYPTDIVSEQPERFFVAEFIREQIFEQFEEEIPYSTAVEIQEFNEREAGKTYINADIIVERQSQKGILIGKNGEALKKVGQKAREEIEDFIQRKVFLELFVKVREHWRENEGTLKRLGYSADHRSSNEM
ncbi:MAG: GTPase Era [Bacteroidota bacterium]